MTSPTISVIMTVRNAESTLPDTLASFQSLDWPSDDLEFVIVDGESTDSTMAILMSFVASSPSSVIIEQRAGGISAGRNEAIRLASAPFIAVTDADMIVPAYWLHQLMKGMSNGVGVVGGPNTGRADHWLQRWTNAIPVHGPSPLEVPVLGRTRFSSSYTTNTDPFAAVTRNCMYRRAVFEEAGGFDESLATCEDGELHQRILENGHAIHYTKDAEVTHSHRDSYRAFWRQMKNYGYGQARANKVRPAMRRIRHVAPLWGFALLFASIALAPLARFSWAPWLPVAVFGSAVATSLGYGLKAAWVRRDPSLVVGGPWLFATWLTAWSVGYLRGMVKGNQVHHD